MFHDERSRRVIFVAHCVLNQNSKIDQCARYPGAMREVALALVESGVGIVQMPCPEMIHLGLDREADPLSARTVESEDTRVAAHMNEPAAVQLCQRLAAGVAEQIAEYRHHGFEVVGIVGINGSPTCGIETGWRDGVESPGPGVFLQAISATGLDVPMRGIKASDPIHAVATLNAILPAAAASNNAASQTPAPYPPHESQSPAGHEKARPESPAQPDPSDR